MCISNNSLHARAHSLRNIYRLTSHTRSQSTKIKEKKRKIKIWSVGAPPIYKPKVWFNIFWIFAHFCEPIWKEDIITWLNQITCWLRNAYMTHFKLFVFFPSYLILWRENLISVSLQIFGTRLVPCSWICGGPTHTIDDECFPMRIFTITNTK